MLFLRAVILGALLIATTFSADLPALLKKSTAYLTVEQAGTTGTAFCMSKEGHFITCAHVLGRAQIGTEVSLTVKSGLPDAKTIKAKILKIDRHFDLAILKAAPGSAHPLPIRNSNTLKETDPITVAGFPFGEFLAGGKTPALSIATGKVTALRREGAFLSRVQFDAGLESGNSGGPLLNAKGEVVGVAVSRIIGSQLNFAIGTDHVRAVITSPYCRLHDVEEIPFSNRHEPYSFDVSLDYVFPPDSPPTVTATFNGPKSGTRPVSVKKTGDMRYTITGVPHPPETNVTGHILRSDRVRISGNFAHKMTSSHRDHEFMIGDKNYFLSNFKFVYPEESRAITTKGETIEGKITGLDRIIVQRQGYDPEAQSFGGWPLIAIRPEKFAPEIIRCKIRVVTTDLATDLAPILPVRDPGDIMNVRLQPDEPAPIPATHNADLPAKAAVITLDAEMTDLDYGGRGRFVVVQVPSKKACYIIDCLAGKITHEVPAESDARIAAGLSTLFIAESSGLSKWDLATGKNIARNLKWVDGRVRALTAGSGSDRFFGVLYAALDIRNMIRAELRSQTDGGLLAIEPFNNSIAIESRIAISERGTSMGVFHPTPVPRSVGHLQVSGGVYDLMPLENEGWIKPGPIDQILLSGNGNLGLARQGFGTKNTPPKGYGLIPTSHRDLALMVPAPLQRNRSKLEKPHGIGFLNTNSALPLVEDILALSPEEFSGNNVEPTFINGVQSFPRLSWDKRFFYSVEHGLLITAPIGGRRIVIHPMPFAETLAKAKRPYLLVDSNAPVRIAGETFKAQLSIQSSEAGPTFEIVNAPDGIKIDSNGLIHGKITSPVVASTGHKIIVRVKTKSLERLWKHRFFVKRETSIKR